MTTDWVRGFELYDLARAGDIIYTTGPQSCKPLHVRILVDEKQSLDEHEQNSVSTLCTLESFESAAGFGTCPFPIDFATVTRFIPGMIIN
jgi:hypothetical protein